MIYLGVEYGAVYHLEGPNGQKAVFNDDTDPDFVGILDPESSGLDGPELREDSNDRVESDGAIFGDFYSGKRPIILQGRIIARTKAERNERVGKLRAASNAKTSDATLWWEDGNAGKVFVNVRRQQPLRITKGWVKEFQLALVSADSRILSTGLIAKTDKGLGAVLSQEKAPTAAGQHPGGTATWGSPTNIVSSNNLYANITGVGGGVVNKLYGNKYGFTIPTGSTILGVEARLEYHVASSVASIFAANINRDITDIDRINEAESNGGEGKFTTGGEFLGSKTDAVVTVGGPTQMWFYTKWLTPAVVNGEKFGAALTMAVAPGAELFVDYLPLKIYYMEALEVTATNEGNVRAPGVIKVKGPIENFYVLNQTTGEILTYAGKVEAGKEIWFNTEDVTATEHGTGITEPFNRFANVGLPADWIQLTPGTNQLYVAGQGGSASTELTVEYRNAWE